MRNHRGLTFIELLLVVSLVSVVMLSVTQAFINGLKLWRSANQLNGSHQLTLFMDQFCQDLRHVQTIQTIPFKGLSQQLTFPTIAFIEHDPYSWHQGRLWQMAAVRYDYDPENKIINRSYASYGEALKRRFPKAVEVLTGVQRVELRYKKINEDGDWLNVSMVDKEIPGYVMIRLMMVSSSQWIERTCPVWVGGAL